MQVVLIFLFGFMISLAQNKLQKEIPAAHIETISINGNQIFKISIATSNTDKINVISILDGEYQNDFQIVIKKEHQILNLSLEHLSLQEIPDDKRNAHKVIAATLHLEIPERFNLRISSDIGSVELEGIFNSLQIELLQGHCIIEGKAKKGIINTLDGDIRLKTDSASVEANSNHGRVTLDTFSNLNSIWKLKSINGNITVGKLD